MADKSKSEPTAAPQSTTSPPIPPYTPRSTSIPDDSETEFEPTPLHSPGGPQYEDLPPSYDFALSDARNGVASLDAAQIEAHRVSANEGPDEPEVWEYRMRGGAEDEELHEQEDAPAYEGHVPVQHVPSSESIPVGRVGNLQPASSVGSRNVSSAQDPPHSIPDAGPQSFSQGPGGRGGQHSQPWTPFGASGFGPFGAQDHGPFGAPGHGPFGPPGIGPFGRGGGFGPRGRSGRGRSGRGARSGPPQDWAAFGQNMGKWGEDFGRRMGNWGEQFGRQAGAMGEQIGRQAGAMGQQIARDAGAWPAASSERATTTHTTAAGSSKAGTSKLPQYDEPPLYQGPVGVASQETGVLHSDRNTYPPEKAPQEFPSEKTLGKNEVPDYDDDSSSSSSDSSDSSDSDSEDDDYDDAFLARIAAINLAAETAFSKGKKPRSEIAAERDLAIARATHDKETHDLNTARKQSRRLQLKYLRNRRRELTREYRQKKRELREAQGKGKGKAKRGKEWKEIKREYKAKRRALKRERVEARREWKRERRGSGAREEGGSGGRAEQKVLNEKA
ncbi:hypothetical protein C7974DRAFT_387019 [Boeremia exigua]|uniref:uncharacterized protein n=1 Tax=Boeremia exigua TaxID=749465 RepID=UPI001E8E54C9|nr:uncharacterized protein C7974DRAFT_387019 [Boeremia exigua]KAH6643203.1 hypothetical protein C7974DRAFT_387019 [Boeremia exigua]